MNQLLGTTLSDYYGFYDFYLASRVRNEVKSNFDHMPLPGPTISLVAKGDWDYYPQLGIGTWERQ